jgi:hypothetical protein
MSRVMCLELGCHETVEIPEDTMAATRPERLPPEELQSAGREYEVICPRGHLNVYVLPD